MDAQSLAARTPFLVRAPLLVREILLAFVSEVNDSQHPLINVFGFDDKTYQFVKQSTAASMLKLAGNLVKANAIKFSFNEKVLKHLLSALPIEFDVLETQVEPMDSIFSHRQVIRELVMFMADSLSDGGAAMSSVVKFDAEIRRLLARADVKQLEWLGHQMVKRRCVQIKFNKHKVKDRTYSQMRHERREGIKDVLVTKKATYAMMAFLFSEESEESVKWRRYRLGVTPLKGRPKTAPAEEYAEFICLWTSNQDKTELDRFLLVHRKLGYSFDVLWTLYQRAKSEGEFDARIMKVLQNSSKNLACQI